MRIIFISCVLLIGSGFAANAQLYQYQVSPRGAPVKMREVLSCDRPAYPLKAQAERMQGSGRFEITLARDGSVESVRVTKSTGHSLLDKAGVAALQTWRFTHGAPKTIRVPIVWTLGTIKEYEAKHRGQWRDPKSLDIGDGEWVIITEH
jgi:TonB family protein